MYQQVYSVNLGVLHDSHQGITCDDQYYCTLYVQCKFETNVCKNVTILTVYLPEGAIHPSFLSSTFDCWILNPEKS